MKNVISILLVFTTMTSCLQGQSKIPQQVEAGFSSGKLSVTDVLTNPAYLTLHTDPSFRELVKKYAKQEEITLVTTNEPGARLTVKGRITDNGNKPLSDVLVYVYHTDNRGLYSAPEGQATGMQDDNRNPKLFGYFRTMDDGSFQFKTIHPQGYPASNIPQHIHLEVYADNGSRLFVTELLFADDKRLSASTREQMVREGAFVASNTGNNEERLYTYVIKTQ